MFAKLLRRIRRNHALEHATINLLSQRHPSAQVMGLSNPFGFTLYTSLTTEEIVPAAMDALEKLKHGQQDLRIHQNCGTNLVVTATLTTLASLLGLASRRRPTTLSREVDRFPKIVLLNVLALLLAQPVSKWVQSNVTTAQDMANVEIVSIFTDRQGGMRRIRVHTRQSLAAQS